MSNFLPVAAWLLAALFVARPATASPSPPAVPGADVESVHAWLIAHDPQLRALAFDAEAARARIVPAGALPDPVAAIEWRDLGAGDAMERETRHAVRQRIPLWGKRGLARAAAGFEADAAAREREAMLRERLAEAEDAYVRYWHADEAVAVLERRRSLLRQAETIAVARYGLGLAAQQDAIRAQVAQTRLLRDIVERRAGRHAAIATLNALLGRAADAPLAVPAGVPALPVGAPDAAAPDAHPAVVGQRLRAEAAHATAVLRRRERWPDVTVGVGAMQRQAGPDTAELMLEVELPLQQHARRESEREARLLEAAARSRADAVRAGVAGRAAAARAAWAGAGERRRLTEHTLVPQAEAAFRSALASYEVGGVDFGTLLEALDERASADLDRLDALRDELLAAAAVRAVEGGAP